MVKFFSSTQPSLMYFLTASVTSPIMSRPDISPVAVASSSFIHSLLCLLSAGLLKQPSSIVGMVGDAARKCISIGRIVRILVSFCNCSLTKLWKNHFLSRLNLYTWQISSLKIALLQRRDLEQHALTMGHWDWDQRYFVKLDIFPFEFVWAQESRPFENRSLYPFSLDRLFQPFGLCGIDLCTAMFIVQRLAS